MTTHIKPASVQMPKVSGTPAGAYHQTNRVLGAYRVTPNAGRGQNRKQSSLKTTGYGKVGRPFR